MTVTIDGTTGVSLVQDGVVTAADLASGAITASALPAGSVLQVVNATYATESSTTSTSFGDLGLSASITPSSTSSKILIIVCLNGVNAYGDAGNGCRIKMVRDIGGITTTPTTISDIAGYNGTTTNQNISVATTDLDDPSSTSAVTYKIQFAARISGSTCYINQYGSNANFTESKMTLMEIAG